MSAQRKLRRNDDKAKNKQLGNIAEKQKDLTKQILFAATALGVFANPLIASADITSGAGFTTVNPNGNVFDIETKRIIDKTGVNVFGEFDLDANKIANMYFGSKTDNSAHSLVNFVNSRININGTVNAIKDSKIGGNLYFLSKDGMAVGSSGVINAGALHVLAPAPNKMGEMRDVLMGDNEQEQKNQLDIIQNWPDKIPLNPNGTITVLGKINATNKIDMRAANILVGIDNDGNIDKKASLKTGVVNFKDLVNISDEIQAGLGGDLTAEMNGSSGNIVLKASADIGHTLITEDAVPDFIDKTVDITFSGIVDPFYYRDISASVKNYGEIIAAGDVDISATAKNLKAAEESAEKGGNLAKITATVDVADGSVSGENVSIEALAENKFIDEDGLIHEIGITYFGAVTPITGDASYAVLDTLSAVNIGKNAVVKSTTGNVNIAAESTTLAATMSSATGYKFATRGGSKGAYLPGGSVGYTEASNKAEVNIDGKVEAKGDINVAATADLKIEAENNLSVMGQGSNQLLVGVMLTNGYNTAQVNINENDNAETALSADNNISIAATAVNDLLSHEEVSTLNEGAIVTAVNVTTYNSSAGVNINRSLEAGNNLSVTADDKFARNTIISSNATGKSKFVSTALETLNKVGIDSVLTSIGETIGKILPGKNSEYDGFELGDYIKAGVTVGIANESNKASINVGSKAGLTAKTGNLTLAANMHMEDMNIVGDGSSRMYVKKDKDDMTNAVNATVLVTNLQNEATVTIVDRSEEDANAAAINAGKGVAIKSSVKIDYDRVGKMLEATKTAIKNMIEGFEALDDGMNADCLKSLEVVNSAAAELEKTMKSFSGDETLLTSDDGVEAANDPLTAATELLTALNELNKQVAAAEAAAKEDQTLTIEEVSSAEALGYAVSELTKVVTNSLAFVDTNSYGSISGVSTAKGGTETAVSVSGTVMLTTVDNNSKTLLGNNVIINAKDKVDIKAENFMKDVSMAGVTPFLFNNAGGNASIGATINIADFDTNTIVAVGKGSHITGGEINIEGKNTINHVGVVASSGMGSPDGKGITGNGMLSIIDGNSKVLTVVDDEASLTAEKNGSDEQQTSGKISIKGKNETGIINVTGGITLTGGNGAVGVGLAYNDFSVHNIAGIGDIMQFGEDVFGKDNDELKSEDGYTIEYTKTGANKKASAIKAYGFDVEAFTDGTINTGSIAGSVSLNDSTGKEGFFGKLGKKVNNITDAIVGEKGLLAKAGSKFAHGVDGVLFSEVESAFNVNGEPQGGGKSRIPAGDKGKDAMPEFSLPAAGSVSINIIENQTKAVVDNAVVNLNSGDMSVIAKDDALVGAYSGGFSVAWKSSTETSKKGTSVALSGAAAINDLDNTISAIVSNSKITDAGKIDVLGLSGGTTIAAGLGLEISKNAGPSGTGGAAVSVNLIDRNVNALMENNEVDTAEAIDVTAYQSDTQVTGGLKVTAGNQDVAFGAMVAFASLNNTINAGITGNGKTGLAYKNIGNVEVHALNALTDVTAAASVGVTIASQDPKNTFNIQGAGVYNEINNTANAYIDSANIQTDADGAVIVQAMDTNTKKAAAYEEILNNSTQDKSTEIEKTSSIIDTKGNSYYEGLDTSITDDGSDDGTLDMDSVGKNGSTIITAAAALPVGSSQAAIGASVAISDIENKYSAKITDSDITANAVEVQSNTDTLLVGVAGGIGVGTKIGAVGSVSWQDIDNLAESTISDSTIKAQAVNGEAGNTAQMINVVGQVSGGKSAIGAGLGYSDIDSVTGAYLRNNNIDKRDAENGVIVQANAANGNKLYTIGASLGIAVNGAAVDGTVVLTRATGKTDAEIDNSEINNAKAVSANAADKTYTYTVLGNVQASAKVAVGAGVAYTDIGGSSYDSNDAGQKVNATIKNTKITTNDNDAKVSVIAKDESKMLNIAAGLGGSGNVAVEGAASTALVNKQTKALLENTKIDEAVADAKNADVIVKAESDSKIFNTAAVAGGSGIATVGAGVAVNRIVQDTAAEVLGGTMNIKAMDVRAVAAPTIETIGVGGGGAGTAAIVGSVAVNMLENNAIAHIGSGANIVADGSVGVVAQSDEVISNYAGTLGGSGVAAVGVSTSVNAINGTTKASIGDEGDDASETKVTAKGNDTGITTNSIVDNSEIYDELISDETVSIDEHIERTGATQKGVVVDASSTRDLKSFLVNAAGALNAGITATVNVNMIEGATDAKISNTVLNGGSVGNGSGADVKVRAADYTNSSGFVGSLGIAIEGAGVGVGSDTNTIARGVAAEIKDSDIKADALTIEAESKQGISSFTVGAAFAGVGAGVAGVVSVSQLDNETKAILSNTTANVATLNVGANHLARTSVGNVSGGSAGVGAGIGLSVGVLKDDSVTEAFVDKSTVTSSGEQNIKATNKTVVNPAITATGIGLVGAGVAGTVSVNNVNSKVMTGITDSELTSSNGSLTAEATNTIDVNAYLGTVAGGAGGVGASVTVNTIDSTVQNNIVNSNLTAKENITLEAVETRNIDQLATNLAVGAGGLNANIIITNVGKELDKNDENEAAARKQIELANAAYGETNMMSFADDLGALDKASIKTDKNTVSVGAGFGVDEASKISVNIGGGSLTTDGKVAVTAKEIDKINMIGGSGAVGAASVNAGVGILNVHRNLTVNINSTQITGEEIAIDSAVEGTTEMNMYQGSAGVLGVNAAYAGVSTEGNNAVNIINSAIEASKMKITARDNGLSKIEAIGIAAGAAAVGAIVAQAENSSDIDITLANSNLTSEKDIDISAERKAKDENGNEEDYSVLVNAIAGTASLAFSGTGIGAEATEQGAVRINVTSGNELKAGETINIHALNAPAVEAETGTIGGSLVASETTTVAKANIGSAEKHLETGVTIGDGNVLEADDKINIKAEADTKQNVDMKALSIGTVDIGVNIGGASIYSDVSVNAGENIYRGRELSDGGYAATDLELTADNKVKQTINASAISGGAVFATGTNLADSYANLTTKVAAKGSKKDSNLNAVTVQAKSYADIENKANGHGGAAIDISPYAAKAENEYIADTDVVIEGDWSVADALGVAAFNDSDIYLESDAVRAAVVGGSGVWLKNTVNNCQVPDRDTKTRVSKNTKIKPPKLTPVVPVVCSPKNCEALSYCTH